MDPEKTAPFELGEGPDACLLVHGFTGSPWDMRPLGEALAARGYYVKGIRLPGHGTTPEAMALVSHADWEQAVDEALLSLSNFHQVFVAGLSMGALLAVLLAARRPERVHSLALLAPAMRFHDRQLRAVRTAGALALVELVRPWIRKDSTDIEDDAVRAQAPILASWPTARLYDLWKVQAQARSLMGLVRAPTLIASARHDHVVTGEGARELARGLARAPALRFIELSTGFHILPRDRAGRVVAQEVGDFFDRHRG